MKEAKKVYYFSRKHFWKFLEKKRVEAIVIEKDGKVTAQNFYRSGALKRDYVRLENGNYTEKFYFMNGGQKEETSFSADEMHHTCWDRDGQMTLDCRVDLKEQIERRYHPNGKLKIQHDRKTGSYEEWTDTGVLKKKGRWVSTGDRLGALEDVYSWFETGNMREKRENGPRQEYVETINAINELPMTSGRKVAKEALVKAYYESKAHTKD